MLVAGGDWDADGPEDPCQHIADLLVSRHHLHPIDDIGIGGDDYPFDVGLLVLNEPARQGLDQVSRLRTLMPHVPLIVLLPAEFAHLGAKVVQMGAQDALCDNDLDATAIERAMEFGIERHHRTARLELEAFHDELTGLPTRPLLLEQISVCLQRANRDSSYHYAVLLVNLDRFKLINDSLGPAYGDQLLVALTRRMKRCLRPQDKLARLGGGEFALLLDGLESEQHTASVCQSLQHETRAPFLFGGREVHTTASIGIASDRVGDETVTHPYTDADEVVRDAGIALHNASQEHGRYLYYTVEMHEAAELRFRREMELRQSLETEDFRLHYQPIVDLSTGQLEGFEVLLRWEHPTEGMVFPDDFIPVAEETGLIVPIERWVLRRSCEQIRAWRSQLPPSQELSLHVNLSGKHLGRKELASELESIIEEMGLDPRWLRLEITESALVENTEEAVELLGKLRDIGCLLAVDDFGTGYSSLSVLQRYPLDMLKVDRSFVMHMQGDPVSTQVVRTILQLAEGLGLDVVAEGIETEEQRQILVDLGCTNGQGYYFSKPVDLARAQEIVNGTANGLTLLPAKDDKAA